MSSLGAIDLPCRSDQPLRAVPDHIASMSHHLTGVWKIPDSAIRPSEDAFVGCLPLKACCLSLEFISLLAWIGPRAALTPDAAKTGKDVSLHFYSFIMLNT